MPYSIAAYSEGTVFLSQLGMLVGKTSMRRKIFWGIFIQHPTPSDIKRTAEKFQGWNWIGI
jgi:hypothetical protein